MSLKRAILKPNTLMFILFALVINPAFYYIYVHSNPLRLSKEQLSQVPFSLGGFIALGLAASIMWILACWSIEKSQTLVREEEKSKYGFLSHFFFSFSFSLIFVPLTIVFFHS